MTFYARVSGGFAEELTGPFDVSISGETYRFAAGAAALMSDAERASYGIVEGVEAGPPPEHERVIGQSLTVIDGVPTRVWATVPFDLDELTATLTTEMNRSAGAFRSQFITVIAGQEATYLDKEREARAFVETGELEPGGYIDEDATRTGRTPVEVAAEILAQADAWRPLNRRIEGARIAAARSIAAAPSVAAKRAAAVVDWAALLTP